MLFTRNYNDQTCFIALAKYLVSLLVEQWVLINSQNNIGYLPMEKGKSSSLFANDGSFMERFKQLEQEKGAALEGSKQGQTASDTSTPKPIISKASFGSKANNSHKPNPGSASGKLAFSLKQKSKLVAPALKLSDDEDEEEKDAGNASGNGLAKRQKLGQPDASDQSQKQAGVGNYFLNSYMSILSFVLIICVK